MLNKRSYLSHLLILLGLIPFLFGCGSSQEVAQSSEKMIELVAEQLTYQQSQLNAAQGSIRLEFSNPTFLPHTFTIDELDVDLRLDPKSNQSARFNAPAGEYTYYCTIAGHLEAGMVGTLIVE